MDVTPPFFPVSLTKLIVMSICSMGFYEVYWFYKNWQSIRAREQSNIYPVARAVFSVFFCYQCFSRIRDHGATLGVEPPLAAGAFASAWIISTIMWNLPVPYRYISLAASVSILPVQAYANRVNKAAAPNHDPNTRFSALNWAAIVVGGSLVVLVLIGAFLTAIGISR
jgi:hypothetical protein